MRKVIIYEAVVVYIPPQPGGCNVIQYRDALMRSLERRHKGVTCESRGKREILVFLPDGVTIADIRKWATEFNSTYKPVLT
jgi:hypothetical protein